MGNEAVSWRSRTSGALANQTAMALPTTVVAMPIQCRRVPGDLVDPSETIRAVTTATSSVPLGVPPAQAISGAITKSEMSTSESEETSMIATAADVAKPTTQASPVVQHRRCLTDVEHDRVERPVRVEPVR